MLPSVSFPAKRSRTVAALVVALSLSTIAACDSDPISPQAETLDEAEALWNGRKPPSGNYTVEQRVACFCPFGATTFKVTVTAGTITRVHNPQTVMDLPANQFAQFRTVEQLFAEVRAAIPRAGVLKAVQYHPTMGYPTEVSLDPILNAVDDEVAYFTDRLVPPT